MSTQAQYQSREVGQSSNRTIPQTQADTESQSNSLTCLLTVENPVANIILVSDIPKVSGSNVWGLRTGDIWPKKIPNVDIYEFVYPDKSPPTKTLAESVEGLKVDLSTTLQGLSKKLGDAIINSQTWKAKRVILVGYGYGGLLCEKAIKSAEESSRTTNVIGLVLFGTPHFVPGLRQWAQIVLEATKQSDVGVAKSKGGSITAAGANIKKLFGRRVLSKELAILEETFQEITEMQRSFFKITSDGWWGSRIASCFLVQEDKQILLPVIWSSVPHAKPVMIRKPYLEMTEFENEKESGYQAISQLIGRWITEPGNKKPGGGGTILTWRQSEETLR